MKYFCHSSIGFIKPVTDWWLLLTVDPEISRYYAWLARSYGIDIELGQRHGPHISVVQGEGKHIRNKKFWYTLKRKPVQFEYSNQLHDDSYHVWVDVRSQELDNIRRGLGLQPEPWNPFHLTLGRLKHGIDHAMHEPRPKNLKKKKRKPNFRSQY